MDADQQQAALSDRAHTPALDVIIVNWNAGEQLRACLESFPKSPTAYRLDRLVIVDNASGDGSLEGVETIGLPLHVTQNASNRGFASACNQGAARSRADYLLFLNPDTRLQPDSLDTPIRFMEAGGREQVAVVGISLVGDNGETSRSCAREPRPSMFLTRMLGLDRMLPGVPSLMMSEWDHRDSRRVDHVIGAFYLVRRRVFEALGGFDERFFVYLEDVDFSTRARAAGYTVYFSADARAYHKGGGTSSSAKPMRLCLSLHSRVLYGYKHFGWWVATGLMIGTMVVEPLVRVAHGVVRGDFAQVADTCLGYGLFWRRTLTNSEPRPWRVTDGPPKHL